MDTLNPSVQRAIASFTESEDEVSLTLAHGGTAVVSYEFGSFEDLNSFLVEVASRPTNLVKREVWYLTRSQDNAE